MIEVICGPMYSGKTEELIRRIKRVKIAGLKYVVIKPNITSRYDKEVDGIVTHSQDSFIDAETINSSTELLKYIHYDVIAIDEVQFFDNDLYIIIQMLSDYGKRIIVSGLDMKFNRHPFTLMSNILSISHKIDKLSSICAECKENAVYSYRISDSEEEVIIGEKELYIPLCSKCFQKYSNERNS